MPFQHFFVVGRMTDVRLLGVVEYTGEFRLNLLSLKAVKRISSDNIW
jgi:hypothetical protein